MGDMKDMMRESMANIKTYGDSSPKAGGRRDETANFKGKNLLDLENQYESVKFGKQASPNRGSQIGSKGSARG